MNNNLKLGLKENWKQFTLLVIINAFVGAVLGLERTILPDIAKKDFNINGNSYILSFIIAFGLTKSFTNYFAGRLSEKYGRKLILIIGWIIALPFPFIIIFAKSWNLIIFSNILLGISQGLTWSTTVIMKIDLVGSSKRGLAMGINEFAGYLFLALSALITGYISNTYSLRPEPFYLGIFYVLSGFLISIFFIKETKYYLDLETNKNIKEEFIYKSQKEIFLNTTIKDKNLSSIVQAGFVNNLNDAMVWGLFPIFLASKDIGIQNIVIISSIYPLSWGIFQLFTGALSDKIGRKILIVYGMCIQAIGILITVVSYTFYLFCLSSLLLGIGTAMVYPTLLASISDIVEPSIRATSIGIYRFWRDFGYVIGALISGIISDIFGIDKAIWFIGYLTLISGIIVFFRMSETLEHKKRFI